MAQKGLARRLKVISFPILTISETKDHYPDKVEVSDLQKR